MSEPQKITYIGKVSSRNKELTFGIKEKDRTKHTYIIGKSGMGKSTLLENFAIQDINNGEGICVIDPHGSMAEKLLDHIPESRIKDVVYFAPFDGEYPMGLNMLEKVSADKRYLVANGLMAAFKKIFTDGDGKATFSARMEYVLNYIILALLENDNQTLLGINRMLFDKEYRKRMVANVTDPTVKDFWVNEYANYTEKTTQELAPAIQNKIGQFVSNPLIRNIIGQQKTSFDVRELMDNKKILIVNLSKGKVGEGNANLLGSLLVTKIYLAAMSRADIDPYEAEKLPPFYFYVDEFQNFANESFASILSEARKYKLALTVAHQYVEQMTDEVKSAVFGNVGTMIVFRIGATDAEVFEKEFAPYFILDDFVNLSAYQIYLRLMIDNQGSSPFSARTLDPIQKPAISYCKNVITSSRTMYAKPRFLVEEEIALFYVQNPRPQQEEKKKDFTPPVRQEYTQHGSAPKPQYPKQEGGHSPITRYPHPAAQAAESQQKTFADQSTVQQSYKKPYEETRSNVYQKPVESNPVEKRVLPIRKITDSTPLPPRRYEQKKEEVIEPVPTKHAVYMNTREIEEQFHKPPAVREKPSYETRKPRQESPLKSIHVPTFDEKPAMSLKDALAKAMSEHKEDSQESAVIKQERVTEKKIDYEKHETKKQDERILHVKKEIDEDVLRKLIED